MTALGIAVLLAVAAVVIALIALTAVGQRRRGGGLAVAAIAGVFFPVAWVAWYVRDMLQGSTS
ncbi:hypothetical protein [Nocardioides sp.]|uniref:hypothetical protein n=1 Tax=Nocardioides sp. TaxID=35761 RepID=UPI0025D900F2|nr:hypothetical protein [Nocardioides sp.]